MEELTKLNELNEAFIRDCFSCLTKYSDSETLGSIKILLELKRDEPEIEQKIYVAMCSVDKENPENFKCKSAALLTKQYIDNIRYVCNRNVVHYADICLFYVALFGYTHIFGISTKAELFKFNLDNYPNFLLFLDKYSIKSKIAEFYQKNLDLMKMETDSELIQKFQKITDEFQENKQEVEKTGDLSKETVILVNENTKITENISSEQIVENLNNKNYIIKEELFLKDNNSNINEQNKTENPIDFLTKQIFLLKQQNSDNQKEITLLKQQMKQQNSDNLKDIFILKADNILLDFKVLETNEKLIIENICNSILLNTERKKIEYLNALISSLKKTIIGLSNPYNLNLWRKLANILLKNIFIVLKKKNYTINQNENKSYINQLNQLIESSSVSAKKKKYLKEVVKKKNVLQFKITKNDGNEIRAASAADKGRKFNLITIYNNTKPEIICSLSTEFLFFLKEKGNKADHFDDTILNYVLFDNLNIVKIEKELIKNEEQKINEDKYENSNEIYKGNKEFTVDELIEMLENPIKHVKEDLDLEELFQSIYERIDSLKTKIGFDNYNGKFDDFITEANTIDSKNNELIEYYKKNFTGNNNDIDQTKKVFSNLKTLDDKIKNKLTIYTDIKKELDLLNSVKQEKERVINGYIQKIKNIIKKVVNLINLDNLFQEFKDDLKNKIETEIEYESHKDIFTDKNINDFQIKDFYSFLINHLNYNNHKYSIIKRDITNFNLFVEVLNHYQELLVIYKENLDLTIDI